MIYIWNFTIIIIKILRTKSNIKGGLKMEDSAGNIINPLISKAIIKPGKISILDGGMGTMLLAAGMKAGEHPEVFAFNNPGIVEDIHKKYIEAGSDIIYSCTFGANEKKLKGCGITTLQAVLSAVKTAKKAASLKEGVKVALDVGPIGELLEPLGTLSFDEAYNIYKEVMSIGEEAGADLIVVETFTDLYDAKAALLAAKENTSLPVVVTMSFESGGRTFTGTTIPSMATVLTGLGADAIGFNCSLGPKEILKFAEELVQWTDLPVVIKPNAGLPDPVTGKYNLNASDYASDMLAFKKFGISMMGGCCGTDPEYINKLRLSLKCERDARNAADIKTAGMDSSDSDLNSSISINDRDYDENILENYKSTRKIRYGVCSSSKMVELNKVRVIGERLNPTGKPRFAQALLEHDMDYISRMAIEQEESGAQILDVNVGVPGADEPSLMIETVKAIQGITSLPLQIDSSNPAAIEAGLRAFNGKAIINSVNADDERLDLILPIAKKYGAAVIGLSLSERGVPQTAQERFDNAVYILKKAIEYGLKKEDVFIDCLTLTVSAQQEQAVQTLNALRKVKSELGLHCVLGVSNISFGLPERSHITESFLVQAMCCGLDLPIINPNVSSLMDAVYSYKVLSGEDENCSDYIMRFSANKESKEISGDIKCDVHADMTIEEAVLKGLKVQTREIAAKLLESMSENDLINNKLIPALDIVGDKYEKQIIFLPQLINSANAACEAFELIKERLAKSNTQGVSKGKIVLATVKGDIHDIGKNIVKIILENYGYRIIDLGRDVPIENVVKAVIEEKVNLVGLSALMTTTLPSMKETIEAVKAVSPECKIWVGGAVLTPDYAMEIGADYYAKDARASVDIAKLSFPETIEDNL